jgi:pentatricopeptide repeat-containing protein PET309
MRMVWKHIFRNACQLRQMRDRNGPSNILCIPLSIFLDGLTTACHHGEAFDTWRLVAENGFGFDAQNWNHLAVALMRSGQPERAFDVVENVLLEKAEQVKTRTSPVVRESASFQDETSHWHETDISSETPLEGDLQDEAAMRPPNRRHQYRRRVGTENPLHDPGDVTSRLLRSWRPADITWRPTFLTIAVLERAYTQLENGIPIMALLAGQEEEVEDGFLSPRENALSEKGATGRGSTSPIVLLARMNRRYARTVSLIMLHRRKRKSRQTRKSKKTEPNKVVKAEGHQ